MNAPSVHGIGSSIHPPPPPAPPASAPPALPQRTPGFTHVDHPIHATITPQTTSSYIQMIDSCVPDGPNALSQALAAYPTMLTYHSQIQLAIDREPNPIIRSQLRQVVSTALVRAQMSQNRTMSHTMTSASSSADPSAAHPGPSSTRSIPPLGHVPARTSSTRSLTNPVAPTSSSQSVNHVGSASSSARNMTYPMAPGSLVHSQPPMPPSHHISHSSMSRTGSPPPSVQEATRASSVHSHTSAQMSSRSSQHRSATDLLDPPRATSSAAATAGSSSAAPISTIVHPAVTHGPMQQVPPTQPPSQQMTPQQPAQQPQAPTPAHAQAQTQPQPQHHPHINGGQGDATNPARIFKLQFDARRIICCSQTSTIVGWDFCNGDPELEEAAKFFGTVE
jgi:F-box and WD-40 domain protein 1/11